MRHPRKRPLAAIALGTSYATLGLVLCAAFSAGFVDAIVGGGGLIQVPALFAAYPTEPPSLLLGTNKLGSICGTTSAFLRYIRVVSVPWRALLPAAAVAFGAAISGASLVNSVSPALFRPLVPIMLSLVLLYAWGHKDLGARHAPILFSRRRGYFALALIGVLGLYDGFFGPGTGSILTLLFIRLYGFDFLHASAWARIINAATNAGALLFFGLHGEVHWVFGLALGTCNAAGSMVGAHTALKHGSKFTRVAFIAVVIALIAKTGYDGWISRAPNGRASFASHRPAGPTGALPSDDLYWTQPNDPEPTHGVHRPSSSNRLPIRIPARGPLR
ncbi:MAG: hypothetical protein NVS9B2_00380 [Steroidobacteraceae bacterium]